MARRLTRGRQKHKPKAAGGKRIRAPRAAAKAPPRRKVKASPKAAPAGRSPSPLVAPVRRRRKLGRYRTAPTDATGARICSVCHAKLATVRGRFCSRLCRQAAWRLRTGRGAPIKVVRTAEGKPSLRFALLDVVRSARLPPTLIDDLKGLHGWAIAAAPGAVPKIFGLFGRLSVPPPRLFVFSFGTTWQGLIVASPRPPLGGIPDVFRVGSRPGETPPTLRRGQRRPLAFGAWVVGLLGMQRGDHLVSRHGSDGVIERAWLELGGPLAVVERPPPRQRRRPASGEAERQASDNGATSPDLSLSGRWTESLPPEPPEGPAEPAPAEPSPAGN
jgi:hypothetical protein